MFDTLLLARPTRGGVVLYTAALLSLGAAAIHLTVAPAHLREYLPFGVFFLAIGCVQIVLAVEAMVRPTRRLALALAALSGGLIGVWWLSRTTGLPFGPTPGVPEDITLADVICNAMEALSGGLFLVVAARRTGVRRRRPLALYAASTPSFVWASLLTSVGVMAAMSGMAEAFNAAPLAPGRSISVANLAEPPGSEPVDQFTLTAAVSQIEDQEVWALNGSVPGPELRVTQGHRVRVTLVNNLPAPTTLHWHGVRVPNAMDGVAGMTQDALAPGQTATYEFVARDAGTYWYHSHQQTESQLSKGLFGALIVEPAGGRVSEERDFAVVLHGTFGRVWMNGALGEVHLDALPGETVRLRLIDAVAPGMNGGPEAPLLVGAPFQLVALDGQDLLSPTPLEATRVPLGMGQRADLVFRMPSSGQVRLLDTEISGAQTPIEHFFNPDGNRLMAGSLRFGSGAAPELVSAADQAPLFDLTNYGSGFVPSTTPPDMVTPLVLAEGPGIRDGWPQLVHTINGQASPYVPPIQVQLGQTVQLHIVNDTDEFHPMHLHGHVMSVLSKNGVPLNGSPVQLDTVMVGPRETWDVQFVADNPGVWMVHCHVLLHAAMGMSETITYNGVYTPFEMGTRSGNIPE